MPCSNPSDISQAAVFVLAAIKIPVGKLIGAICKVAAAALFDRGTQYIRQALYSESVNLAVVAAEMQSSITASALAAAIENAERERAASPDEVPIAEWEVQRVQRRSVWAAAAAGSETPSAASPPDASQVTSKS